LCCELPPKALEDLTAISNLSFISSSVGAKGAVISEPMFEFQAHDETTSGLSFSPRVPNMLVSSSIDKTVKVWDVQAATDASIAAAAAVALASEEESAAAKKKEKKEKEKKKKKAAESEAKVPEPQMVAYKTMNVGKLFTVQYCADEPFMMAAAGDKGEYVFFVL
jgi:WD40 repeat protein